MTQPPAAALSVKDGPITRDEIDARSRSWIDEHVMYDQGHSHDNQFGSYRRDCSGYVSMCWNLSSDPNTRSLPRYANEIPREQLTLGDILIIPGRHVALFVAWAPDGRPVVREAYDYGHPTVERSWNPGYASEFTPMRYDQVVEGPPPGSIPPGPPPQQPPAAQPGDFRTWGSDVRVHTKPSTQSDTVCTLPGPVPVHVEFQVHGERVNAYGLTNDGWSWVPALNGFISNLFIDVADEWLPGVREGAPAPAPQQPLGPPTEQPPGQPPQQGPLPNVPPLDGEQVGNAKIIIDTGKRVGLPEQAWVIAVTAALQESSLRNLGHGDELGPDSCGLFQQRPNYGWGTREQCMDPVLASEAFYGFARHTSNRGLDQVPGWRDMSVADAAQHVQGSEDGSYYAKHEQLARTLVNALK